MANRPARPDAYSWDDAQWYRTLLLQLRYGSGLRNRAALADIIAKTEREQLTLPSPRVDDEARAEARAAQLKSDGFCRLGSLLNVDAIEAVRTHLTGALLHDEYGTVDGAFTSETVPPEVNIGTIHATDGLANCPHLLEAANHPDILAAVERFLGAPPTVQYYTAWWSFAGRRRAREAQLFHYDRNCFRFVKLFIYLTDVDREGGPHVFVRGSADVEGWMHGLEAAKRDDPENAPRFLEMINAVRKRDQDVHDFFGPESIEQFIGQAGEAFLVDTSGIHKGLVPVSRDRLLFQATFALLPALKEQPKPVPRADLIEACVAAHGNAVDPSYLRYVNRIAVADPTHGR